MIRSKLYWLLVASFTFACGATTPLKRIAKDLEKYPEFSITLADMKEDGNFFKEYYHRYKTVYKEKGEPGDESAFHNEETDWLRVKKDEYQKYQDYLGMVLLSKSKEGKISNDKYPAGYQYVGDSQYGKWQRDSSGGSFWEWYGKYAMFSTMFGMFNRPIYQSHWNDYSGNRRSGRAYYGPNREYGTRGSYTKKSNPSFFERRQKRESARKSAFSQKVKERTRRSKMSGVRSRRSGGFGK